MSALQNKARGRDNTHQNRAQAVELFRSKESTVESKDQLTTVFVSTDIQEGKQVARRKGPEWTKLDVERQNLELAILQFNEECPDKEDSRPVDALASCRDFQSLTVALEEQKQIWQKRKWFNGKPQEFFHRVCKKLDGHETILSAFPEGNEYVSVFCATFKTIVTASRNYQAIAENIAKDIEAIGEVVHLALDRVLLWKEDHILAKFASLYSEVFLFFKVSLDWYRAGWRGLGRRIASSLNSKHYETHFSGYVANIQSLGISIQDKAEVFSQASVRKIYQDMQYLRADMHDLVTAIKNVTGRTGEPRSQAEGQVESLLTQKEMQYYIEQIQLQRQGESRDKLNQHLELQLSASFDVFNPTNMRQELTVQKTGHIEAVFDETVEENISNVYKKAVLVSYSEIMETSIYEKEHSISILTGHDRVSISQATLYRLQSWLGVKTSTALWLSMPQGIESFSDSSVTAANITKAISDAPGPVQPQILFHCCQLPARNILIGEVGRHEAGLISLLYSLIIQIVHGIPPEVTSSANLEKARFQKLDGTMHSWADAISLFEDLLAISMPYLFCIISDFGLLDYGDGSQPCRDFVVALRRVMTSLDSQHQVLKILFTTAGSTRSLSSLMERNEIYHETESARRRQRYREGIGNSRTLIRLAEVKGPSPEND